MLKDAIWAVCIIAVVASGSQADVTISSRVSMPIMNVKVGQVMETICIKNDCIRNESVMSDDMSLLCSPYEKRRETVSIKCLDQGVKWTLNPEDSSYTIMPRDDPIDTLPVLVEDQRSIDSFLTNRGDSLFWQFDTIWVEATDHLGFSGRAVTSTAIMYDSSFTKVSYIESMILMVPEESYTADAVTYYKKSAHIAGLSKYPHLEPFETILSRFGASLELMNLDTLSGIPVKGDISFKVDVSENLNLDFDARLVAEQIVGEEILEQEFEKMNSGADTLEIGTADEETDSLIGIYENIFSRMKTAFVPGWFEVFGMHYEITGIDTTALPDSLFEIPEGYTER